MYEITPALSADAPAIEALLDAAFGPDRKSKTSYRFREGVDQVADLSYVIREHGRIIGSVSYWPILIGESDFPALLLGPLAVNPLRKNEGIGRALVFKTLDRAAALGHRLVLLVGDPAYYSRFGFSPAAPAGFDMPGEDPARLQLRALDPQVLKTVRGTIKRSPRVC